METTELNQPIYFTDAVTSERKSENVLYWGERLCLCVYRSKKLWIPSKLKRSGLSVDMKEKKKNKNYRTGDV